MQARLIVLSGPDQGRSYALPLDTLLQAGRLPTAHVYLTDRCVSRIHCTFQASANQVVVADANSTSGTYVNGQQLGKPKPLQPGDVIQIGATSLRFVRDDLAATETLPPDAVPVRVPVLPAERLHELTGTTLAHFEVGPELGRGLSGVVFRSRDTDDGKTVALKVLFADFATDEEEVQRFIRAMKTMLPLKHPHLVGIHNAGKTGPYCWISMELVEGDSVAKILEMLAGVGAVDWRPALRVAVHVSRALVFAHHHRIVHRNIAPQNILIRASDQTAKLGDLMLAKALEGRLAKQITRPGEVLGDVRYLAPERTQGKETDLRSDFYGLGATVYAMLTGKPPFDGSNPIEILTKVRKDEPVRPKLLRPNLPDLLEATVLKMLAKRPEHRHQTAIELLSDLDRIAKLAGVPV